MTTVPSFLSSGAAHKTTEGVGLRLMGKRIMVVDDEIHITGLVDDMLSRFGARVQRAHSGAEALSALRAASVDLVVCDQNLPDLSGPGLYKLLTDSPSGPPQRFLFITGSLGGGRGSHTPDDAASVDFLQKPFRMHDLVVAIERLLDEERPSA